ncbi:MAG: DmsC/YnfH family molybdoenzyme membrane anchor subunit [Blastopirellula sp. JB062]
MSTVTRQAPQIRVSEGFDLVQFLLDEQQDLSAVERFSQRHADVTAPLMAPFYRELLPTSAPTDGEQYAFEVDLDACSGCKACVVACHQRNGLEEDETWRTVGTLQSDGESGALQHITTACHHCADPGCLRGCPVQAYEKDPVTGIVVHLDDQCIGCKYCTMMCPYDVPQYSETKKIVRKCDMCRQRLDVGEAPACVQACPNQAIRITLVDQAEARASGAQGDFLQGAAHPATTAPTTRFVGSTRQAKLTSGDLFSLRLNHGHLPLVVLLVFTQLSVGAALAGCLLPSQRGMLFVLSTATCAVGLAASGLHLGRPLYGFRVFLGLRTSWLSREAILFGKYFALIGLATASVTLQTFLELGMLAAWLSVAVGVAAVYCSIMIYVVTQRPVWGLIWTSMRFGGTALLLGVAASLATQWAPEVSRIPLGCLLIGLTAMRCYGERRFMRLADHNYENPWTRTVALLNRKLSLPMTLRNALWGCGGALLPLTGLLISDGDASHGIALVGLLTLTAAELIDRYLYFASEATPSMPGIARLGDRQ